MEWFVFGVDDAIDVEEFILPTGEGDPAWILLDELNPEDDGCWRPNIEVAVAPSHGWPKLKLFGSPILRLFAGDDNELNEAIVNDGITGVIPDDSAEGDGTMDGEDETWVGIKDPIVVGVDDNGDMIKPPSWGEVNIRVAPGTGTWPETAAWFIDHGLESLPLFSNHQLNHGSWANKWNRKMVTTFNNTGTNTNTGWTLTFKYSRLHYNN